MTVFICERVSIFLSVCALGLSVFEMNGYLILDE